MCWGNLLAKSIAKTPWQTQQNYIKLLTLVCSRKAITRTDSGSTASSETQVARATLPLRVNRISFQYLTELTNDLSSSCSPMRRRSFDRGSDVDTKRRLLLSSSYSQLPSANSSGNDAPSNQFGARQGAGTPSSSSRPGTTQGFSRPKTSTVDSNSGLVKTNSTSNPQSLRRRAKALKKKKPNFPQHPKRPLPRSSAIDYFNEAFQQTFPPPIVIDDSDINAASLLRDPPVVRESTTSPSRTRPPYISPPPLSLQIESRSTRSTRSTPKSQSNSESTPAPEIFPFHSSTPFSRRRPSSGVNPENTLRNPEKISEELIEHDAKYLKNYRRKVRTTTCKNLKRLSPGQTSKGGGGGGRARAYEESGGGGGTPRAG